MHHLTLRQLDYFVEIIHIGNMTRAASRLHVAPTALSLQVRAMEERLGVSLLQRHSRGVRPTAAGAELYQKARQILELVDEAERLVAPGGASDSRPVRLGVIPNVLRTIGVDAVLTGDLPAKGLAVQLVEGLSSHLVARLEDRDIDFALVYEVPPSPSIATIPLMDDHFLLATRRADARQGGRVTLEEALSSELVFYSESDIGWNAVHAAARLAGLPVRVAHEVGSIDVIRHMVTRGLGTAIVPFGIVKEEVDRGEIAVHQIRGRPIVQRLRLAWIRDSARESDLELVVEFVSGVVADLYARTKPYSELVRRHIGVPVLLLANSLQLV